jgi:hypothetical protein
VAINTAIAAHAQPIEKIDEEFAERAQALAKATGPTLDWAKPKPGDLRSDAALEEFVKNNPNNFEALMQQAAKLIRAKEWDGGQGAVAEAHRALSKSVRTR